MMAFVTRGGCFEQLAIVRVSSIEEPRGSDFQSVTVKILNGFNNRWWDWLLLMRDFEIGNEVIERVETVAYKLELPQQLSRVHNTFHMSNLKKCLSDESLVIPLEELTVDDKLHFVEEPIEVMDREIKQLKRSRIPIIKVKWNSKQGPEFT
ncbi:hypothetical protein Tco_1021924 [Tanacetum coccineum]